MVSAIRDRVEGSLLTAFIQKPVDLDQVGAESRTTVPRPIEGRMNRTAVDELIARSRANVAHSRWLCAWSRTLVARSVRLCPKPIVGASDANGEALGSQPLPLDSGPATDPEIRRSGLVVAHDPVMRAFIADAISRAHDIAEAADVPTVLKIVTSGARVDVVVAGCFMFDEAWAIETCTGLARALYEEAPWVPVVVIADTPPPTLRADLLLTGVRTFLPRGSPRANSRPRWPGSDVDPTHLCPPPPVWPPSNRPSPSSRARSRTCRRYPCWRAWRA
jgi:hypothetical protein